MKLLIASAFLLMGAATYAGTAEYYVLQDWMGEYPTGYQLTENINVSSVKSPEDPQAAGECTLKKDIVIHPWAVKTKSEFVTLTGTVTYKANQTYDLEGVIIGKDEVFKQLSYLSEGICLYDVKGQEVEATCLDIGNEPDVEVISTSAFPTVEYFKTKCIEGNEAWISVNQLKENLNYGVIDAKIIDYGSVEEP